MAFKKYPELAQFLSSSIAEAEMDADELATEQFLKTAAAPLRLKIAAQLRELVSGEVPPVEEIGTIANRWFAEEEEARAWFAKLLQKIDSGAGSESTAAVRVVDSNGTALSEGDSVTVIKDLKVRGGSSDLKRGTMIKKIHLVDDPEVIECRVDGSTLVLKTCFLKKA